MKQPRKKVVVRRPAVFNKGGLQEVFDPPNYELFSLRDKELSSDLAELSDELDGYHKLRRSSTISRCIHEHHCGTQASSGGSTKQSRTALSSMELSYHNDFSKPPPMKTFNSSNTWHLQEELLRLQTDSRLRRAGDRGPRDGGDPL